MPKVIMGQPRAVFAAPVSRAAARWGVYCLPKIWRLPDGRLVIRVNGVRDLPDAEQCCPDVYFFSSDEGKTWLGPEERNDIDLRILGNVEFPCLRLGDGRTMWIRPRGSRADMHAFRPVKRFPIPNSPADLYYVYRQGSLTDGAFALERVLFDIRGNEIETCPACFDFDSRELFYVGLVGGSETHGPLNFHSCAGSPFLSALRRLPDGTLIALATGQCPAVADRFCGEAYLMVSEDGGLTWRKRSVITANAARYPYGLCGDGQEASLSVGPDGTLYCVTRTNMCIDHVREHITMEAMLFISTDGGYTWSPERPVAENSVTPHIIALKNGLLVLIYGRPGVHIRVSADGGRSFSAPYSVIGPTLAQELSGGKSLAEACRFDVSYSNSFYVMQSDDTFLLLYTDLAYDPGDGLKHKASLVRSVTVKP